MLNPTLNTSSSTGQEWGEQLVPLPEDVDNLSRFGVATALSRDGKLLAVGSPLATTNGEAGSVGVVYVYRMVDGQWELWMYFPSGSDSDTQFGAALSLSADGSVLAIGAPVDKDGKGSVYVFQYIGNEWSDPEELPANHNELLDNAKFGSALSLSGNGSRLVVGAPNTGASHGRVMAFRLTQDGSWIMDQSWAGTDRADARFGDSVSISADGNVLVVGEPERNSRRYGCAFIGRFNSSWPESITMRARGGDGNVDHSQFGSSVSLNQDGSVLVVGSRENPGNTVPVIGALSFFKYAGSSYEDDEVTISQQVPLALGGPVSLSNDGLWLAVGAPTDERSSPADYPSASLYHGEGDEWREQKKIAHDDDAPINVLGTSVGLSGDGTICAIGAPAKTNDDDGMVIVLSRPLTEPNPEPGSGGFSKVPGVYVEEVNSPLLSIPTGATAIPVFIGRFRTPGDDPVPNDDCLPVKSWLDFTRRYGDSAPVTVIVTSAGLRQGRKGGGTLQETIDVAHTKYLSSLSLRHYFENGGGRCYILSLHDRRDPNERAAMAAKIARCQDISLICLCEVTEPETDLALYDALSSLLNRNLGYFLLADVDAGPDADPEAIARPATPAQHTALYYPGLETSYSLRPADTSIFMGPDTDQERLTLADLDATTTPTYAAVSEAVDHYFSQAGKTAVYLRATPAVAGAYCKTDRERGVWKAPANVALAGVRNLYVRNGNPMVQFEAKSGVNQIRYSSERGAVIMGARTMAPPETPPWLYVPVRRLFDAAERDIKAAMRFAIFKPASPPTWEAVRAAIDNYLYRLWRDGALRRYGRRGLFRPDRPRRDHDLCQHRRGLHDREDRHGGDAPGGIHPVGIYARRATGVTAETVDSVNF
ncbi:phage tail sheath family protein [Collimonas humicola]|uniref:phage tail sheath family protein n=1 Tax=Collimonas humicola TaxID=2825886 RepID=UPI001B8D85E7|nr:phage tail sheath family protein [Collimonas humicola]